MERQFVAVLRRLSENLGKFAKFAPRWTCIAPFLCYQGIARQHIENKSTTQNIVMNVTMQKTGDVSARLSVEVKEEDYKDKVTKEIKDFGRTHVIPGFRKGHVPFGELERRFGRQIASDVVNHEVYEAVVNYLRDNKVNILGDPMPVEVKELDLKKQKDYTFEYDLILAPELNVEINGDIHVPYRKITVTDEMVKEQDEAMRKRYGKQEQGEETTADALVKGVLMQLNADGSINENDGAIQVSDAIVGPAFFKSKEEAEKFAGKKVGDKVVFNPWNTCEGNPTELSSMLRIDKSIAGDVKSDFEMTISEIIVVKPAELGEEYFTMAFGKDKVHNEEEYMAAVKDIVAQQLAQHSEMYFRLDAQKVLMEKFGDMKFADELLKKWLINRNEGLNEENIDEEYTRMLPGLKWQLITERVAEQGNVKVTEENLLGFAKANAARQFASYGMLNLDDEIITNYAKQMLADKDNRNRLVNTLGDIMLFDALKKMVTVDEQEMSFDDFKKMAEAN